MNTTPPLSPPLAGRETPSPMISVTRYQSDDGTWGRSVVQISSDAALACGKLTHVRNGGQPTPGSHYV